ncbi:MAG: sigma-70 family RNA polymerase sigma factor [Acidobacteria bacterium]|nr:sigma-70 family RNA polymerase sigma factor [Acidobacteriota bacterium]
MIEQFWLSRTEEAFCALFEVVYPRLRRYFLLRGMENAEAEDLSQNVMIVIHRHAGECGMSCCFRAGSSRWRRMSWPATGGSVRRENGSPGWSL